MGLLSLLIGSIGIINTMQVIVRRRTVEVAVLKTLGLQANQITLLFLVEAVLMGIFGSLIGIVLGWGLTFLIRGVAERLLATNLPFVLVPAAALTGFVVGVIVTTVFGFLPTLTAGQVRPGVVLRPSDAVIPKAGRVRTLLSLVADHSRAEPDRADDPRQLHDRARRSWSARSLPPGCSICS